jgi:hypothetical protein
VLYTWLEDFSFSLWEREQPVRCYLVSKKVARSEPDEGFK